MATKAAGTRNASCARNGCSRAPDQDRTMMNADQLLAKLYALRKDYADDPEDETYQALHHAFLFISYNMGAFKDYVKAETEKAAN
jgi:hypothetical protein